MGFIDLILIAIIVVVTWCVASEGAWGAALTLISVIFAGLLAMNYFEWLAVTIFPATGAWSMRADIICLVGLFALFVFLLRLAADHFSPSFIHLSGLAYEIGRWGCGLLTGYIVMAFLLTALHTASLPREFIGFKPERKNLFDQVAPDRQWLGFMQFVSEFNFRNASSGRIFDGPETDLGLGQLGKDNPCPYPEDLASVRDLPVWPSFVIKYAT